MSCDKRNYFLNEISSNLGASKNFKKTLENISAYFFQNLQALLA